MSTKSGKRNPGGIQKSISSSNNSQASKSPSSDASGSKVTRARSVKHTAQTTANTKDADNENVKSREHFFLVGNRGRERPEAVPYSLVRTVPVMVRKVSLFTSCSFRRRRRVTL